MSTLIVKNLDAPTGESIVAPDLQLPSGSVVQMVSSVTTSNVTVSSTTKTSLGCSVSITPTSSSSKIFIIFHGHHSSSADKAEFWIERDGTALTSNVWIFDLVSGSESFNPRNVSATHLDTSNTTSTITYDVKGREHGGSSITFNGRSYASGHYGSRLTLMEIAG